MGWVRWGSPATAAVSAVNFDYRGFDTLGEEFILFAAVVGVASLLRGLRGEHEEEPDDEGGEGRGVRDTSAAGAGLSSLTTGAGVPRAPTASASISSAAIKSSSGRASTCPSHPSGVNRLGLSG